MRHVPHRDRCIVIKELGPWSPEDGTFSDGYHWISDLDKRIIIQWTTMPDTSALTALLTRIKSDYIVIQVN